MEGKVEGGLPSVSSPSLASELVGKESASAGIFNSIFSPAAAMPGRDSSRSDIFGPPRKHEVANQPRNAQKAMAALAEMSQGAFSAKSGEMHIFKKILYANSKENRNKENVAINKDKNSFYQSERSDVCSLSSSLFYGGQDICALPSSQTSKSAYDYKTDEDGDTENSHFASRGNWWQGSLYY